MAFDLHCVKCGLSYPFKLTLSPCSCGGALTVRYDLERAGRTMTKDNLVGRISSMWRYKELLPLQDPRFIVSLGEGWTPLIRLNEAEQRLPLKKLWVKREEQNPTGSFKSRGFSVAVSLAKSIGMRKVAVNSNGNAASALAAYAAYGGIEAFVFLPRDCQGMIVEECVNYGARTYLVDGLIHDAGVIVKAGMQEQGWHHVGTLQEPGRAEGKKTMGLELAEQLNWKLPDVIIYPTGGGSGIIGMWNAFEQLKALGFIDGDVPRFVCVQEEGCTPIVNAMDENRGNARRRYNIEGNIKGFAPEATRLAGASYPSGMRVPQPPDLDFIVSILRQSGGTAVSVTRDEIQSAQFAMGKFGISSSPEGAATWAGLLRLIDQKWIKPDEEVVLFNTSHAMKYLPYHSDELPLIKTYDDFREIYMN